MTLEELYEKREDAIEKIIDDYSINTLLEHIASVCLKKAEHVRTNWQDGTLAKDWEKKAKAIYKVI